MLSNRRFLRKAIGCLGCLLALSITVSVSVAVPIAMAQETKQVLYPERGYWGIIDKTGKFVFDRRFERCPDIQENDMLAAEYSTSNRYESDLHYFSYDFAGNRKRALASGPDSPCWEDGNYSEGLTSFKEDGLFGFFDQSGKKIIPAKYRSVGQFKEGYAIVGVGDKTAVIDKFGQLVWQARSSSQKLNDLNISVVNVGTRYFVVRYEEGRPSPQFLGWFDADEFYHDVYRPMRIDPVTNRAVVDPTGPHKSGIALRKDGSYRESEQVEVPNVFADDLAVVKRDGRWRFINRAGETKILLAENTVRAYPFMEGLAVVLVDCNPHFADSLSGSHRARRSQSPGPLLYGVIDKSGAFVIPPKYSLMGPGFVDGLLKVGQGSEIESCCGFVNKLDELVIPLKFDGAGDFHNGIAAVFINDPAKAKQKADELSRASYLNTCIELMSKALRPFYDVANLRFSISTTAPPVVRLEKWAGPSKLRRELHSVLASIDLPALPAAFIDQANLEFAASRQHGVVAAGSPRDPFNSVKARLLEEQMQSKNIALNDLSTAMLERKWQSAVAWYDWPVLLDPVANALLDRYQKDGQTKKLAALKLLVKELSSGLGKSLNDYVYNALAEGNKLFREGKSKEAGEMYQKAAGFFDKNSVLGPNSDWPPISLTALYTYSCFLASQKQYKESNAIFERVLEEALRNCDTAGTLVSQDYLDTYLELIRQAQPEQYLRYRAMAKQGRLAGMHATGFIDQQGNVVIPPDYKTAKGFRDGLAAVETVRGWGYVDKSGAWKIEPTFEVADNFGDGLAPVSGRHQFFPLQPMENAAPQFHYIDSAGRVVIDKPFSYAQPFVDGIASVQSPGELGRHCIDKLGNNVCETNRLIELMGDFILESHALPKTDELQDSYFTRNFLLGPDKDGQYKIVPDDLNPFFVEATNKTILFGYKDAAGKVVIEPKYFRAQIFTEELAAVQIEPDRYAFIDKGGVVKIPGPFSTMRWFHNGLAWVEKDNKQFLIDTKGEIKSDRYDRLDYVPSLTTVIAVKGNQRYLFSDEVKGLDVSAYSTVRPFHEGLAAVEKDYRWGFIDTSGKLVIPMKYAAVGDFSEGVASAYFP
jgi:tetratricopeptide (TPR) repeat protein